MAFHDHFSAQAGAYARYRPRYPPALFDWLAAQVPAHALAWDCGTGSGQAAVALAAHFERVVVSDPSAEQIAHAEPRARALPRGCRREEPPPAWLSVWQWPSPYPARSSFRLGRTPR